MEEIILNGNAMFFRGQQVGMLTVPEGTLKEDVKSALRGDSFYNAGYDEGYDAGLSEGQADVA